MPIAGCYMLEDGDVQFTIENQSVNQQGKIKIQISFLTKGQGTVNEWLVTGSDSFMLGTSEGNAGGNSLIELTTTDKTSVHFFVTQKESFTLKPGQKKTLIEFLSDCPTPNGTKPEKTRLVLESSASSTKTMSKDKLIQEKE